MEEGILYFKWVPRSQVPSHLRSIRAISTVEIMEVGTYHFKWGPNS
jgi:hypothetical protein